MVQAWLKAPTQYDQTFSWCNRAPRGWGFQKAFGSAHGIFSATLGVYSPWRSQRNVPSSTVGRQGGQEQVAFGFAAVDGPKGLAGGVIHHSAIISAWPHLRMEPRYRTQLLTNVCMLFTLWLGIVCFARVCMWTRTCIPVSTQEKPREIS